VKTRSLETVLARLYRIS